MRTPKALRGLNLCQLRQARRDLDREWQQAAEADRIADRLGCGCSCHIRGLDDCNYCGPRSPNEDRCGHPLLPIVVRNRPGGFAFKAVQINDAIKEAERGYVRLSHDYLDETIRDLQVIEKALANVERTRYGSFRLDVQVLDDARSALKYVRQNKHDLLLRNHHAETDVLAERVKPLDEPVDSMAEPLRSPICEGSGKVPRIAGRGHHRGQGRCAKCNAWVKLEPTIDGGYPVAPSRAVSHSPTSDEPTAPRRMTTDEAADHYRAAHHAESS